MLNFEEELKKFKPSPELGAANDSIYQRDLRDVNDIVQELVNEAKRSNAARRMERKAGQEEAAQEEQE